MLGSRDSQHSFAQVPSVNIGRSSFDRSFTIKDTFDFDYLIPIMVDEVLPGDTINLQVHSFARLATQIVPVMDNMYLDYFFFFVPNRLLWEHWERFNGAQDSATLVTTEYTLPTMPFAAGKPDVDSLYDKMGLPTDVTQDWTLPNTLPLRAYNRIWNEWFRDQNLQNPVIQNIDDGPDAEADYVLLKRGKRHDYFTSALPWPQKGDAVSLPLGTTAPIVGVGMRFDNVNTTGNFAQVRNDSGALRSLAYYGPAAGIDGVFGASTATGTTELKADLSSATAATINELRQAMMVQSILELDARGGTRYVEILRSHFGVVSPDFRLQRSEFLAGGSTPINVHPVPQTSSTSGANVQAGLASFATASTTSRDNIGFSKSFVEHGYVMALVCARADITYQQGLNKLWQRSTRYDFFWPKLQQLGEQSIKCSELYMTGDPTVDDDVFGYQERYAEYRYKPSEIHGRLRSTYATSLDQWHLAEEFSAQPTLNAAFIVQNTPIERAIAIDTEPDLIFDAYFKMRHARPMMTYSIPATLGRF